MGAANASFTWERTELGYPVYVLDSRADRNFDKRWTQLDLRWPDVHVNHPNHAPVVLATSCQGIEVEVPAFLLSSAASIFLNSSMSSHPPYHRTIFPDGP